MTTPDNSKDNHSAAYAALVYAQVTAKVREIVVGIAPDLWDVAATPAEQATLDADHLRFIAAGFAGAAIWEHAYDYEIGPDLTPAMLARFAYRARNEVIEIAHGLIESIKSINPNVANEAQGQLEAIVRDANAMPVSTPDDTDLLSLWTAFQDKNSDILEAKIVGRGGWGQTLLDNAEQCYEENTAAQDEDDIGFPPEGLSAEDIFEAYSDDEIEYKSPQEIANPLPPKIAIACLMGYRYMIQTDDPFDA